MKKIDDKNYISDEGKVFTHIVTNKIMGYGICLGIDDSIDNYMEIDLPEEYKGNEDYDNTIKNGGNGDNLFNVNNIIKINNIQYENIFK